MMRILLRIFSGVLLLAPLSVLTGCASLQPYSSCDVSTGSGLPILHPAAFAVHQISSQQIHLHSAEQDFEFISQLEISPQRLILVALTPLGQKLFQIDYQAGTVDFQRFGIPDVFDPAYLLSDISFIYGPRSALQRCLLQAGLAVKIQQDTAQRRIIHSSNGLVEIRYATNRPWNGAITLNNQIQGYQLEIQPLSLESL